MKFCDTHWQTLRAAIRDRGLYDLVASSGAEAARRTEAELKGAASPRDFDPLMAAHNMILSRTIEVSGLGSMMPKEDGGEWCPLCFLIENCPCGKPDCKAGFESWIDKASDAAREVAVEKGLVARG